MFFKYYNGNLYFLASHILFSISYLVNIITHNIHKAFKKFYIFIYNGSIRLYMGRLYKTETELFVFI